jgi:hypothetical protein
MGSIEVSVQLGNQQGFGVAAYAHVRVNDTLASLNVKTVLLQSLRNLFLPSTSTSRPNSVTGM